MERVRVSINLNISAIVLLSLILLTTNAYLIFACIILLAIHLDFLYFPYSKGGFDWESLKHVLILSIIMITSTLSFNFLPIDTILLSNLKLGLLFGLFLSIFICGHFVSKVPEYQSKTFGFMGSPNQFKHIELMLMFVLLTIITLILYHVVAINFFAFKDWILFLIVLFVLILHGSQYSIWSDLRSAHRINHKIGLGAILIGTFFLFFFDSENFWGFLALLFFIIGITCIQHSTYQQGEFRLNYTYYFILPSLFVWVTLFVLNFCFADKVLILNKDFLAKQEKDLYFGIKEHEKALENEIYNNFNALKKKGVIPKNAEPIVKLDFNFHKSLFKGNTASLKGYFSYNYEKKFKETIENYPPGVYLLENSNISKIVIYGFHTAINNHLSNFLEEGRNVDINLLGTSDAISFSPEKDTRYQDEFGEIKDENFTDITNGLKYPINIRAYEPLQHQTLALLRSFGIKYYIKKNIPQLNLTKTNYSYKIYIDRNNMGDKFRKSEIEIIIYDIAIQSDL